MSARQSPIRSGVVTGLFDLLSLIDSRLRFEILLAVLRRGDEVGGLCQRLELEFSQVSRSLRQFDRAGLVRCEVNGQRHHYTTTEKVQLTPRGDAALLVLRADDGAEIALSIPAEELGRLASADRSLPPTITTRRVQPPSKARRG